MRATIAAVMVLLAGCQSAPAASIPASPTPAGSATGSAGQAAPSPASTATALPSLPPVPASGPLLLTVSADQQSTIVTLYGTNGSLLANARAADRTAPMPSCHPYLTTYLPCVSASNTRAYYLDGDAHVRYLAAGSGVGTVCNAGGCQFGSNGAVTEVPGGANLASAFSVSPDDRRIAVSTFLFKLTAAGPVPSSVRVYVEDLTGGGNHVELFASTSLWVWPVGWHDGKIVFALGSPTSPQRGPYGAVTEFHLVDPLTGNRLMTLGSATCHAQPALLSPAGTVCLGGDGSVHSQYWSGTNIVFPTSAYEDTTCGGAALSLDGNHVSVCFNAHLAVVDAPSIGGAVRAVPQTPNGNTASGGWIDATHLTYTAPGGNSLIWIDITSPNGPLPLPFGGGELAGRVPGGL